MLDGPWPYPAGSGCVLVPRVKRASEEKKKIKQLWHSTLPDFKIKQGNSEKELKAQRDYE